MRGLVGTQRRDAVRILGTLLEDLQQRPRSRVRGIQPNQPGQAVRPAQPESFSPELPVPRRRGFCLSSVSDSIGVSDQLRPAGAAVARRRVEVTAMQREQSTDLQLVRQLV